MNNNPPGNDKELRQTLINYLGERSENNLFNFFDLLRQSKLLAPAQIDGLSEDQAQQLHKNGQIQVKGRVRVKNSCLMSGGKKYLPIFTCRSELEKGPKCNCICVPLSHFRQVLDGDPEIVALIVDPFSKPNLVIPRERLQTLLDGSYRNKSEVEQVHLSADTRVIQPDPFPQELAGSLYVLLDNL
ncbi:MAG: SseB family protein, partial [Firmicutes bacterium]|nr:SseB family protein [Bacillota bacterium]